MAQQPKKQIPLSKRAALPGKNKAAKKPSAIAEEPPIPPDEELDIAELPPGGMDGAPPWIVTFADLTTLMLTFFVLMLSFANMDIVKFKEFMGSSQEAFGVTRAQKGEFQAVERAGSVAEMLGIKKKGMEQAGRERETVAELVYDAASRTGLTQYVQIFYGDNGEMRVKVDGNVMFPPGQAIINARVEPFIEGIANIMLSYNFTLFIEGHTDSVPISTKEFPSNWELSTVRATTVLRKLAAAGVPQDRLAAVGYADRRPLRDNSTVENRAFNRRVEFRFIRVR